MTVIILDDVGHFSYCCVLAAPRGGAPRGGQQQRGGNRPQYNQNRQQQPVQQGAM